jgi:hypothetical protein
VIKELNRIINDVPLLLQSNEWNSLLINKYPPVIHRLSLKISEDRTLLLHKLFNTKDDLALMHSHSWSFACKVLQGEYEMGVGFSEDRDKPPKSIFTSFIRAGDIYEMLSPNIWHYTKPTKITPYSYSIMLIGPRCRERKAQNNLPLNPKNRLELLDWFKSYFQC